MSGGGVITNNASGVINFSGGASNNGSAIINNGTFNVNAATVNSGVITNNTLINIAANSTLTLTGASNILGTGNIIGAGIGLNSGLAINNNFTTSSSINNVDNITINTGGSLTLGVGSTLTNYSNLTVDGNLTASNGQTFIMNAVVNVNGNADFTGNFEVDGGTFNVNNSATFNMPLTFNNGISQVNALTAPSITFNGGTHTFAGFNVSGNVDLNNGANLTLNGNASANNFNNAGSLTINSPITLTGNYTLTGTHNTEFTAADNIGTLTVTGNANLAAGTIIVNITNDFIVPQNQTYNVVVADGTLTPPSEANMQINNSTATVKLYYQVNNHTISLGLTNGFSLPANISVPSNNANNVLEVFEEFMASDNTDPDMKAATMNLLVDVNNAATNNDLSAAAQLLLKVAPNFALSPVREDPYSALMNMVAIKVASIRTSYQAGHTLDHFSLWVKPMAVIANQGNTYETLGYKSSTVGLLGGADFKINRFLNIGLATGFAATQSTVFSSDGSNDVARSWLFIPYFSIANDNQALDVIYSYSNSKVITNRIVSYGTTLMKAWAKYPSNSHILNFLYGYNFKLHPEFIFTPKLAFKYSLMQKYSYQEAGDIASLNVSIKPPKHLYEFGMGFNILQMPSKLAEHKFCAEFSLMGFWSPGNRKIVSTGQFLIGGSAFDYTMELPKISLRAGLSMTYSIWEDVDFKAKYYFKLAKKYTEHTASVEVRYLF
jgi:hypothetical protein